VTWKRGVNLCVGVALVALGFLDVHVYVISIVVGLWLVGTTSGELIEAAIVSSRRREPKP
jgi:hypothetical protein